MFNLALPFRQVHLDFHTSPHIEEVGAAFDPDEFAETLARADVNSVTCFARCHHGLIYYDSQENPERIHPHLVRRNLLPEQIEACHRRGIRVPVYTTIQWDDFTADEHRDWLCVDEAGRLIGTPPLQAGFYRTLDVFHPGYRRFIRNHLAELFRTMPVDGLFLDIVQPRPSLARHWLDAMDNSGLDPEDPVARQAFANKVLDEWKLETSEFIRAQPGFTDRCTIFYNAGHIGPRHRSSTAAYTHYELESLPSGGWGYLHFPVAQRFARGLGKQTLGMTGKFHTSWGDFQSYKNPAALQFECFHMLALGARCSVGDQLHPSGQIDPYTYDLIGGVYADVAKKEPWCAGAEPVADIGVFTPEEFPVANVAPGHSELPAAIFGAVRMLQELRSQFDIITTDRDLSRYRLLLLPDQIPMELAFTARLEAYLDAGGKVIASFESGLDPDGSAFASARFGVERAGLAPFSPDFVVPGPALAAKSGLNRTGYVMYQRGMQVAVGEGSEILAQVEVPYFNRTWRHFSSHRHTPSAHRTGYPGIVRTRDLIYFSHPIFSIYQENAPLWCRKLLGAALDLLLPEPAVRVSGPSSIIASLSRQASQDRLVLHLLHYIPERRGQAFDVIEDVLPVRDIEISVLVDSTVRRVLRVPEGETLPFRTDGSRVGFTLPALTGHQMVELSLA